jgi:hypothetical protein
MTRWKNDDAGYVRFRSVWHVHFTTKIGAKLTFALDNDVDAKLRPQLIPARTIASSPGFIVISRLNFCSLLRTSTGTTSVAAAS